MGAWGVGNLVAAPASTAEATPAVSGAAESPTIQAIQQAPDPSALVNAFAKGIATDHNNPKLYAAYVARMVDLGLPGLAYHQAKTLIKLDPQSGLGWGVIAYVDASRANMIKAIKAINKAAQYAPDNKFVQGTAGEIMAWYDVKGDKTQITANAKAELAKVRTRLETHKIFTQAYNTAQEAYKAEASATQTAPTAPQAPGYAAVPPTTPYYNNYYYDWGPGWVAPSPWQWWAPLGYWNGFTFFPQYPVAIFNNHEFFEHHHFHQGRLYNGFPGVEHREFGLRGFEHPGIENREFGHGGFEHRAAPRFGATTPFEFHNGIARQGTGGFHPALHGPFAPANRGPFHPAFGGEFHGPAMGGGHEFAGGELHGESHGGEFHGGGFHGGEFHGGGFHGGGSHR